VILPLVLRSDRMSSSVDLPAAPHPAQPCRVHLCDMCLICAPPQSHTDAQAPRGTCDAAAASVCFVAPLLPDPATTTCAAQPGS